MDYSNELVCIIISSYYFDAYDPIAATTKLEAHLLMLEPVADKKLSGAQQEYQNKSEVEVEAEAEEEVAARLTQYTSVV